MNAIVAMRRSHTAWNIKQNPSSIVIQRKGQKRENGKITNIDKTLEAQLMRLYAAGGSENVLVETQGERQIDRYYRLLASWDADIQASTEVKDTFYLDGQKYEVKLVSDKSIHGQKVGKQVLIERVI
ncbi:hypothetical protein A0U40_17865 [[Bacillus] sp. KCTC 13219]|nr:hypothetical protein A0U40_17865 [[Bacillus] sp. KCTC 13219]